MAEMSDAETALALLLAPGGYRNWYRGEDWGDVNEGLAAEPTPVRELTLDRKVSLTPEEMELVERIGVEQHL